MLDSDLQSGGGNAGDQPIPPGYWINPQTGQLEPIPTSPNTAPQIPLPPGAVRDPNTGAVVFPPGGSPQSDYDPTGNSNVGLPGINGQPIPSVAATVAPPTTIGGSVPGTNIGTQTPPDIYNSPLTAPFTGTFTAPAPINLGGPAGIPYIPPTPTFTGADAPPQLGTIPQFAPPSVADALNDPGYQFRRDQGMYGVQNAAAARGTLNDSSTFKALSDYNQAAAGQEYANVFDRALNTYGTNLQSQYELPYQANFQNWVTGTVNPTMTAYSTQATAGANQNNINYENAWQQYLNNENMFTNWQDRTFSKLFQTATA